jgi:hypothetical protein
MLPKPVSFLFMLCAASAYLCGRQRMVSVMSLRMHGIEFAFVELARFESLSHIRCLRNELIGCGVQGNSSLPCLLNWKTGKVETLPPSPEGDVSSRRCCAWISI